MAAALQRFLIWVIAVLIAIMLFRYWRIGEAIFMHTTEMNYLRTVALVVAYFGLNIAAIIGLIQVKSWRTLVACIAIVFSTIFFSTEYIPVVMGIFERSYRPFVMLVGNLIVLLFVVFLHGYRGKR